MRPGELSVVCDTMLQGLGRQLRTCGVDVKILETTDDHDEAAKVWIDLLLFVIKGYKLPTICKTTRPTSDSYIWLPYTILVLLVDTQSLYFSV